MSNLAQPNTPTNNPSRDSHDRNHNHQRHRCTLDDYLLQGTWQPSNRPQVRPGYELCTIDPRQDCRAFASSSSDDNRSAPYLYQKWIPRDSRCALRQLSPAQVKRCLWAQRVVFLGDSLARNQQQSLKCMLIETDGRREDGAGGQYGGGDPPSATSPRMQAHAQAMPPINALISSVIPRKDIAQVENATIVVVGTGPHWNPYAFGFNVSYSTDWSQIAGGDEAGKHIVRAAVRERIQALQALPDTVRRVIWRMPDLTHSSAPNSKDPWNHKCAPFPASWDPWRNQLPSKGKLQWIYDAVREYAEGTRVEVMDVMGMSGQRADGRPSAHLNRTRDGIAVHDCLHWCLPGVPDAWNEVLINYLCQDVDV